MNKKLTMIFAVIAVLAIAISSVAIGVFAQPTSPNATVTKVSSNYIRVDGIINKWGTTSAIGLIQSQAKVAKFNDSSSAQLASATAMWTTNLSRPINAVRTKQNFTYTFYEAKLRNASVSTLSTNTASSTNYFLNGTWTIYAVTSNVTIYVSANGTITNIHRSTDITKTTAYGALTVTDNWSTFTLAINGINPLTGSLSRYVQRDVQFNPFKVTDDTTTNTVTRADVNAVGHSLGAVPGWGNYNPAYDVCGHFQVDLCDLATVAANVGNSN